MHYLKSSYYYLILLVIFFSGIIIFINGGGVQSLKIGLIFLINFSLILLCRKQKELFVVFLLLFYFNYSAIAWEYIFPDFTKLFSNFYSDKVLMQQGLNIMLIFWVCLYIFFVFTVQKIKFKFPNDSVLLIKDNVYLSIFFLLLILFNIIFNFQPGDTRATISPMYEYSIVFILFSHIFSGNRKIIKSCIIFISMLVVLQNILYGERITALQVLLELYFLYFKKYLNTISLLLLGMCGLILMTISGAVRGDIASSSGLFNSIVQSFFNEKLTLDTAYSAYYTSLTFVKYYNMTTVSEHIGNFLVTMGSYITGMATDQKLQELTHKYFAHWWGGFLPFTFYYWFGYIGVVFSSILTWFYLSIFTKKIKYNLVKIIGVYVAITVPRWYLYEPSNLIRGSLLIVGCYLLCELINALLLKRRSGL